MRPLPHLHAGTGSRRSATRSFRTAAAAVLVAFFTGIAAAVAAGNTLEDQARQEWMAGYLKFEEAGKAEKNNNQVLALQMYREAVAVFVRVQAKYPKWNQSLLDFRIKFCNARVQQLEALVASRNIDLSKAELITLTRNQEAKIKELTAAVADLEKKREFDAQALKRAQEEAARSVSSSLEMDKVLRETKALRESKDAAEQRAAALLAEVERLESNAGFKEKSAELQRKLDVALARQKDLETGEASYKNAIRGLQTQLKTATADRDRLAGVNKELAGTANRLQTEVETRDAQTDDLKKKLAAAEKNIKSREDDLADEKTLADGLAKKVKEQTRELADLAPLKDQNRRFEKERRTLEQTVAAREKDLDAARKNTARLETDLGALRQRLVQLEKVVANPADLAQAAARQAIADVARLEDAQSEVRLLRRKLDEAGNHSAALEEQLADARRQLASAAPAAGGTAAKPDDTVVLRLTRDQELAAARRQLADLRADLKRQSDDLDALQRRSRELGDENKALRKAIASATAPETVKPDAAADATRRDLEQKLADLKQRYDESVQLGRRQNDQLTALEKEAAALREQAKKPAGNTAEWQQKLADRDRDLEAVRQELAQERAKRIPGSEPILEQLRQMNRDLDQEREKTRALEQSLQQVRIQGAAALAPAVPPGADPRSPAADRAATARTFLQQAAIAEQQGKAEAAVWNYRKALDAQPDNKVALKRLGILAAASGNQEETETYLKKAFYADPDDIDILLPLGYSLVRQAKADLAVSMLARAAALRPQDAAVHRAYGVACSSLGWMDAAEAQFRRTLDLNPADGDAAFNLAVLLVTRQPPRLDEAREFYRKARELGVAADPGLDKLFEFK